MSRTIFLVLCFFLYAQAIYMSNHDHIVVSLVVLVLAIVIHVAILKKSCGRLKAGTQRRQQAIEFILHPGK